MKYILLVLICTTALLSAQELPNDYDRFIVAKICECEKEIQKIEGMIQYAIRPEYTKKDPAKQFSEPETVIIYLKGKRDAYNEFLYELD